MSSEERDRPGDVRLEAAMPLPADAAIAFIGHVRSAHASREATPKNPSKAREQGGPAALEVKPAFRPGLVGLDRYSHVIVLGWLHRARRDIIQITRPGERAPRGVLAMRAPLRPNPISMSVARILSVDVAAGRIEIDAIDLIDGTPIVDIKPYRPGIDAIPDAVVP